MYKITNIRVPKYITDFIPKRKISYNIRNGNKPFFLIAELKVLKIDFSYILLRLGIV